MNDSQITLVYLTNSPGELSYWVKPVATFMKRKYPKRQQVLLMLPCQYATGEEIRIAEKWNIFNKLYSNTEILSVIFKKKVATKKGVILYFGGDPFFAQLMSLRYSWPLIGYTETNQSLGWRFTTIHRDIQGDLMSLHTTAKPFPSSVQTIGILPGSRQKHYDAFWPIIKKTMALIQKHHPYLNIAIHISPFIKSQTEKERTALSNNHETKKDMFFDTIDFLIALPGSNNAEAMYRQIPMLITIPLNRPDLITFDGLLGLLGEIPFLGTWLKKSVIQTLKKQDRYYSLPNKILGKKIVKEYIDTINPNSLYEHIIETINDHQHLKMQFDAYENYNKKRPKNILTIIDETCEKKLQKS